MCAPAYNYSLSHGTLVTQNSIHTELTSIQLPPEIIHRPGSLSIWRLVAYFSVKGTWLPTRCDYTDNIVKQLHTDRRAIKGLSLMYMGVKRFFVQQQNPADCATGPATTEDHHRLTGDQQRPITFLSIKLRLVMTCWPANCDQQTMIDNWY